MATRMQQRRGTALQWTTANPILNAAELGWESDTNKFKIGDGTNHWDDLDYFIDESVIASYVTESELPELTQDAINTALVAGTGLDKTYNDEANTITLDIDSTVATKTYADTAVSTHASDTTSVHGITDTSVLVIGTQLDTAISNHSIDTTDVHGITNTAELATKTFAAELLTGATKTNITISGDKNGLTITAENGVADSNTDNLTEGSTNKYFTDERAQDAVGNAVGSGLSYNDSTGAVSVDTTTIQARVTDVSDTEIGYLNGVTSAIQTQMDAKAPLNSPTFTGTVSLPNNTISQAMLGDDSVGTNELGGLSVTNEKLAAGAVTDAKVSGSADIAQSKIKDLTTDLAAKAPLASPTFTGTVTTDDLIVDGDFTVNGTNFSASATSITIEDNLVQLAHQNAANTVDLGIVVGYNDGTAKHAGIVRDVSENKWKLFEGVTTEPSTTVDFTQGTLDDLQVAGFEASSATIGDVSNTELQYLNGVTSAIQTQLDAKLALAGGTMTGAIAMGTSKITGLGNPSSNQDAATKAYADAVSPALTWGQLKDGKVFA